MHRTASLRFQPTKRPQLAVQKSKPKIPLQKSSTPASSLLSNSLDLTNTVAKPPAKTTLADWTGETDENDVNGFYGSEKRQRGGRKKRKKNKEESSVPQNWDDIYDPSRPNNYEDYKHSDERIMEIREWKDKLYAHRTARRRDSDSDNSDDHYKPRLNSASSHLPRPTITDLCIEQFPPPGLSFVPPPTFDDSLESEHEPQAVNVPDDPTGEDAYVRRMRLSGLGNQAPPPEPLPSTDEPTSIPPSSQEKSEAAKPLGSVPNISRAPVRYNLPVAPSEIPASEAELESALQTDETAKEIPSDVTPRSLRPGQKGFAERLMSKYGWSKGSGLGASGSGIVNPLRVQIEKQKKKPDSEGGGFVGPGGMGKILGGKKKGGSSAEAEEGKFGAMSEVIVLRGMVDGMELDAEIGGSGQGGLIQEIGEECGEKVSSLPRWLY